MSAGTETDRGAAMVVPMLNVEQFPAFYRNLMGLRFPLPVAQVLELRFCINNAVDRFHEPPRTPDYRDFRQALISAIDSFGVENDHHHDRLLKTLTLIRELHYQHSIGSRNREVRLRTQLNDNRVARDRSLRYALFCLIAGIFTGLFGLAFWEPGWPALIAAAVCGYLALDFFQSLPVLDRSQERLRQDLNDVLRERVRSLNWKTLIHKLALVLGFKKIRGIEVFRITHDNERDGLPSSRH